MYNAPSLNTLHEINGRAKTKLKAMGKQTDVTYFEPADEPMGGLGDGTEL